MYIYFLQTKYALIQYFMWTITNHNIKNIYLFAKKKKKKKKKNYWQFLQKSNIHCKCKKYILGKISIVGYDAQ